MVDTIPTIREVSPLYGPEAGGTEVTLIGSHLARDNGSFNVTLGGWPCEVISQWVPRLQNRMIWNYTDTCQLCLPVIKPFKIDILCCACRQEDKLVVKTPPMPNNTNSGVKLDISVTLYIHGDVFLEVYLDGRFRFEYRRNPYISEVDPLEARARWVWAKDCFFNSFQVKCSVTGEVFVRQFVNQSIKSLTMQYLNVTTLSYTVSNRTRLFIFQVVEQK